MRNFLVEISYKGTAYHGYQVQSNALSIMEVVQDSIEHVIRKREPIVGCSRTDTGVHANSYFFNMKTESPMPTDKFIYAMNNSLPNDIAVLSCREVSLDFHARYCCKGKEYIYQIYNAPIKNPFLSEFSMYHRKNIDDVLLNEKAQVLVGTHDFSAFCSTGGKNGSKIRTVQYLTFSRMHDMVKMRIKADGFLYNMVRIIVGTLVFMNDGIIGMDKLQQILDNKDRSHAGKTAPPQGLFLNMIEY